MRFPLDKRLGFYREMVSMMRSNFSLEDGIEASIRTASDNGKKPGNKEARVLSRVLTLKKDGASFGEAMSAFVPKNEAMILSVVEKAADFPDALEIYIEMAEKRRAIVRKIKIGVIQPIVQSALLVALVIMFSDVLVPNIVQILPMDQWTGRGVFIKHLYNFRHNVLIPMVILIIAALILSMATLRTWAAKWRKNLEDTPPWSFYRSMTGIDFFIALSTLTGAGVTTEDAVDQIRMMSNKYVKRRLDGAYFNQVNGMVNIGQALNATGYDWPDPALNRKLQLFAETRDLSSALLRISRSWIEEIDRKTASAMSSLSLGSMILVVLLALLVLFSFFGLQDQAMSTYR